MNTKNNPVITYNGIGFGGMLTILFIGLKLTGYISWSWLWVLSPLWIPLLLFLAIFIVLAIVAFFITFFSK